MLPIVLVAILGRLLSSSAENAPLHAYSPGDIIIGGLLPMHKQTNRKATQGPLTCSEFDLHSFLQAEMMIYAIGQVNQGTPMALPNFTLGYEIFDTCRDVSFAIKGAIYLLDPHAPSRCVVPEDFQTPLWEPRAKVVIGEKYSDVSIAIARVLALSSVAQISYSSTSEQLSKKLKFPTFLRTIPSDEHQTLAITGLVRLFNWRTVGIIGSDDAYGKFGSQKIDSLLSEKGFACVEFLDILPDYFSQDTSQARSRLERLVKTIRDSSAEAIIMFTKDSNVDIIIKEAIRHSLNRTWIASDSWSISQTLASLPGIERAGEVFGVNSQQNEVPGFRDHVMSKFSGATNHLVEHYLSRFPPCANKSDKHQEGHCSFGSSREEPRTCVEIRCLAKYIDEYLCYNIYLAVQVIVKALTRLLQCDNHLCKRSSNFSALELLTEIRKVNLTIDGTHIYFDENGDPNRGYDILYWNTTGSAEGAHVTKIGEYWPGGEIKFPQDLLTKRANVTVTLYNCSKTCSAGHELKRQNKLSQQLCCNGCFPCADGEYSNGNGEECKSCGEHMYSSPEHDGCLNKTMEYLAWTDSLVIVLNCISVFGIIVIVAFTVMVTIHRKTPIVKAVGGYLCFLELFSLLVCFSITFSFMGVPSNASCKLGLPIFGLSFSLCIACILANLLQILAGFSFQPDTSSWAKKLNKPLAVVSVAFGLQLGLCVPWVLLHPARVIRSELNTTVLLMCKNSTVGYFVGMLLYMAFMALSCILLAYKGKQLPDLYKNAKLVTNSMLLFLVLWIIFIPIYITLIGKYTQAVEVAGIITSSYSILGGHLAPKCYIMVFRKEINNESAITEYIRKHYERKDIPVMRS